MIEFSEREGSSITEKQGYIVWKNLLWGPVSQFPQETKIPHYEQE